MNSLQLLAPVPRGLYLLYQAALWPDRYIDLENYKFNIHSTLRRGNRDFRGSRFAHLDIRV
ncbi:hypothetical protein N7527_002447 [Penicillium freii]|nr:hypothetical protein N7527_002447 [Penicillium freii]